MKALLVISNGRGIIAEADDMQGLQAAYDKAVDYHHGHVDEHMPRSEQHWPAFGSLGECHEEGVTGTVCILKTDDLPNAAKEYYLAGFVE